jgi:hypothetical protein
VAKEIPTTTTVAQPNNCVRMDECTKMVQEISKTLISEHLKLFATTIPAITQRGPENEKTYKMAKEIKELANNTYQTIEEVKKMVEAGQSQQSEKVHKVESVKLNKVMNDLNGMVR